MKVALWILIGLVIAGFAKGIYDMNLAFDSGESAQSILIGAIPMYLLGLLALAFLGYAIRQLSKNEKSKSIQEQATEE